MCCLVSYVDNESELLPYLLEIAEFNRVKSSRTLGHRHTVSRNRVSHIVVVDQIHQRSLLDAACISPCFVYDFAIN